MYSSELPNNYQVEVLLRYLVKALDIFHTLKVNPLFLFIVPLALQAQLQGRPIMVSALAVHLNVPRNTLMRKLKSAPEIFTLERRKNATYIFISDCVRRKIMKNHDQLSVLICKAADELRGGDAKSGGSLETTS